MSNKQSRATKRANAQRAAERAAAIRKEQENKERRRRTLVTTLVVVGVLGAIVAIAAVVQAGRDTTGQAATPPAGVVGRYALPMGPDSAPVTVEVYEDFMCPFCGQFEQVAGEMLNKYADAGNVQVRYRMVSFLDRFSSGTDYSTRAMNAVGVALDEAGRDAALELHDALFANQPAEGTDGLSDEQIIDLAVQAGADRAAITGPIEDLKFEQWVENASDHASKEGYNSTPSVVVDGERVEFQTIAELLTNVRTAIDDALAE